MKTSVIEVHDMLSVLSVLGVEQRIGDVPGVDSVTVNFAAGSATVRYDETRLGIADIRSAVRQSGHESATPSAGDEHEGHKAPGTPATLAPAAPKTTPIAPAKAGAASAGDAQSAKVALDATPSGTPGPSPSAPATATAAPTGDGQQDKEAPDKSQPV